MKPVMLDDERYIVHVEPGGVTITAKHILGRIPGETYILDAAFFTKIAETFREEQHKVQVFSNMEALYAALSLTQAPSAIHTPQFVEIVIADAGRDKTGQSNIIVTCSCGKIHTIRTHGDLDTFRSQWYKTVMEGI